MKLLLIGAGGREHALAWKMAQSPQCDKLYIAPGNAGTKNCGENVPISVNDFEKLKAFCVDNQIDMVVVGPEDPLVNGIYDNQFSQVVAFAFDTFFNISVCYFFFYIY